MDALYAKVSKEGIRRPSIDPMLMIREGEEGELPASKRGVRSWVIVKTRERLSVRTRVHADSGYSSYGAPQLLPELFTSTCNLVSFLASVSARRLQSSIL